MDRSFFWLCDMITKNLTHEENTAKQHSDYLTQCVDLHLKTLLANIFPGILVIFKCFNTVAFLVSHSCSTFSAVVIPAFDIAFLQNCIAVKNVCIIVTLSWVWHVPQRLLSLTILLRTSKEPSTAFICSLSPIGLSFLNLIIVSKTQRDTHADHRTNMIGILGSECIWVCYYLNGLLLK